MSKHSNTRAIAIVIVSIATILAVISSWTDAPIVDEIPHIGAGYSYLTQLDYRFNPEHPPLVKDIAAVPLLFLHLNQQAFATTAWSTEVNGQWNFGRTLIFESGNNADTIKNLARLSVLLVFFLTACYFIWRWSYERYGDTAALIATTLFAFSPTVLAHARLVTTDVAAATGVLVATYYLVRYLRVPSRKNFWLSGITLGLALLCKFSTALLGPYILLVAIIWGLDGRWQWQRAVDYLWRVIFVGLVSLAVVWGVYMIQTWNYPIARQHTDTVAILGDAGNNPIKLFAIWASDKPVIRALGHWTLGLSMVQERSQGGNTIYWLGQVVTSGGPWYFPLIYFIKEPLAWWVLFGMALTAFAFHRQRHRDEPVKGTWWSRNTEEWVWLLWLVIYWAISIHSTLNIGVRHLLPIYPFMIMLVAGRLSVVIDWLHKHDRVRLKWISALIAVLLGWYVFESVHVFPYYLTYFNQIAGGPTGGYRYVTDSNLDWGQDLRRLGVWVEQNHIPKISLDYFGWSDPVYYLKNSYLYATVGQFKNAQDFIKNNHSGGWIAISATYFQQANYEIGSGQNNYRWLLDYTPATVVGNSIFVFHIK